MLQYFEKQLSTTPPLDKTGAAAMIAVRVQRGGNEETLSTYFNSKIGKRLVYFMKEYKNTLEVIKCFEDEVEDTFKHAGFNGMSSSGYVPRFKF